VNEIAENLKCRITHDFLIDPVTRSNGTVYERVAIRSHPAAKREEGESPRGPTTNQPLLPMRHEGKYGADDEDACFYSPACEIEHVLKMARRDTAAASGGDLFDAFAAIKRGQASTKGLLAKMKQSSWVDAVILLDFFLEAQAQPAPPRLLEHEGLQGVPPELTLHTAIIDPQTNFPISSWMAMFS